jgi:hypothetical protein
MATARLRAPGQAIGTRRAASTDLTAWLAAIACIAAALLLYGIALLVMGSGDDDESLGLLSGLPVTTVADTEKLR